MAQALEHRQGDVTMEVFVRKMGRRSQVTIPRQLVKELQMQEGDHVSIFKAGNAMIVMPVKMVPKGASFFEPGSLTRFITEDDIKEAMAEAKAEYHAGKIKGYEDVGELFADLGIDAED